jgi:hypothetical protein
LITVVTRAYGSVRRTGVRIRAVEACISAPSLGVRFRPEETVYVVWRSHDHAVVYLNYLMWDPSLMSHVRDLRSVEPRRQAVAASMLPTATFSPPAPIPSAVDPHTVERAWFRASRWSAPLYERPGRPGPRLLGSAWVDGGRDGSTLSTPLRARGRRRRPLHPGAGRSPAGGIVLDRGLLCAVLASWPPALSTCGRASAQRGRSGPKAGAAPGAAPGSAPGGAERSRA